MTDQSIAIEIRKIEPGDKVTGLSLGEEFTPLKIFLQKHAKTYHAKSLAITYVASDPAKNGKIIAYITLVCGEISLEEGDRHILDENDVDYRYLHFPAIKIARLAVDRNYRNAKLGSVLVDLSLGIAKDIVAPSVGCRFVVVDAKTSAVGFYLKAGFTLLDTATNRARGEQVLFIDLQKAHAG